MILIEASKLSKAIAKAKAIRPRVQFVRFRQYVVKSPNSGNIYRVTFSVNPQNGAKQGHCTCKAGENSFACWHLAAAIAVHQAVQAVRVAARESRRVDEMIALNPS